jgi:hypothetical protein
MAQDHRLPRPQFLRRRVGCGGASYETLAVCRSLALARAAFGAAIAEKPRLPVHDPELDACGEAAPHQSAALGPKADITFDHIMGCAEPTGHIVSIFSTDDGAKSRRLRQAQRMLL